MKLLLSFMGAVMLMCAQVGVAAPVTTSGNVSANSGLTINGQQLAYYHRDRHWDRGRHHRWREHRRERAIRNAIGGIIAAGVIANQTHYRHHSRRNWQPARRGWNLNPNGYRSFMQHSRHYCTYQPYGMSGRVRTPCYGN